MATEGKPLPPPGARAGEGGASAVARHPERLDEHGRRYVGNPNDGCRHCGAVVEELRDDGAFVAYRPATRCCADNVRDMIAKVQRQYDLYRNLLEKAETPGNRKKAMELQDELYGLRAQLKELEGS